MGQYYKIVNLDKKQFLHPHRFDDGLKLMEFGQSGSGTLLGLTILLADGNNRGGGDCRSDDPLIGSWAGDRIVITGDYADPHYFIPEEDKEKLLNKCKEEQQGRDLPDETKKRYAESNCNLYTYAEHFCEDISSKVVAVLTAAGEWQRGKD